MNVDMHMSLLVFTDVVRLVVRRTKQATTRHINEEEEKKRGGGGGGGRQLQWERNGDAYLPK